MSSAYVQIVCGHDNMDVRRRRRFPEIGPVASVNGCYKPLLDKKNDAYAKGKRGEIETINSNKDE